jgi:hypothetical protein
LAQIKAVASNCVVILCCHTFVVVLKEKKASF